MKNKNIDFHPLKTVKKNIVMAKELASKTTIDNFDENYRKLRNTPKKFAFLWNICKMANDPKLIFYVSCFFEKNKNSMKIPKILINFIETEKKEMIDKLSSQGNQFF